MPLWPVGSRLAEGRRRGSEQGKNKKRLSALHTPRPHRENIPCLSRILPCGGQHGGGNGSTKRTALKPQALTALCQGRAMGHRP